MNGLDIVITSYRTRDLLIACLDSLRQYAPAMPLRITVTDNASDDGSVELVRERYPEVTLLTSDTNRGFGAATNRALRRLEHETVLLLNADTQVTPGCLDRLLAHFDRHPEIGMVGPAHVSPSGQPQLTAGPRPTPTSEIRRAWRHHQLRAATHTTTNQTPLAVAWISGSAMLVRREVLRRAGLFDENFFLYFEDIDLCLRTRAAGYGVHHLSEAVVVHHGGASAAQCPAEAEYEYRRSQLYFWSRHGGPVTSRLVRAYVAGRSLWVLVACSLGQRGPSGPARAAVQRRVLRLAWKGEA